MRSLLKIFFAAIFACGIIPTAKADSAREYEILEVGSCSDRSPDGRSDGDRLIKNAINYAKSWCNGSGGVKKGDRTRDWTAKDEDDGLFCRVRGEIICNN